MAVESASPTPEKADDSKAEVHDNADVVDDTSREVSKKRQTLSDLFTIVSVLSPLTLLVCSKSSSKTLANQRINGAV